MGDRSRCNLQLRLVIANGCVTEEFIVGGLTIWRGGDYSALLYLQWL